MRVPLFLVCATVAFVCTTVAFAQTTGTATTNITTTNAGATKKNLGLMGDRFKPLTYDEMTPGQKTMIDHLLAGERQNLGGPSI
jgi:hypothetical protein